MACTYIKDLGNHKEEAAASNTMGRSTHNLHLRPCKGWRNDNMIEIAPINNNKKKLLKQCHNVTRRYRND